MNLTFKQLQGAALLVAVVLLGLTAFIRSSLAATVLPPNQGGTGTSTKPTSGQLLTGQSNGTYGPSNPGTFTGLPWNRDAANGFIYDTTSTDKVGIGTQQPSSTLHLVASAVADFLYTAKSSGTTNFSIASSSLVKVLGTSSSTIQIGGTNNLSGCIVMGSSSGTIGQAWYFLVDSNGALTTTSTRPTACRN